MKGDPSSHKYIREGDRIGLMIKEEITPGQMIETGVMVQTAIQDKNYWGNRFRGNFRGDSRQSSREG